MASLAWAGTLHCAQDFSGMDVTIATRRRGSWPSEVTFPQHIKIILEIWHQRRAPKKERPTHLWVGLSTMLGSTTGAAY
jgi:hypothetical protein